MHYVRNEQICEEVLGTGELRFFLQYVRSEQFGARGCEPRKQDALSGSAQDSNVYIERLIINL
jgi:hypothetical protein